MSGDKPADLDAWVDKLSSSGMPIFSETVREVTGVVSRGESSARDLANAIGKDASLAARVLKIANSPLFNLQHRHIETISSAVVLLGFDAVRDLAVSLALIEQVLRGRSHERVTASMARSFHAAAQASSFAARLGDGCPEEVFVAALLMNIGEMAFWSAAGSEAAAIDRMARSGASINDAQNHVLGFPLEDLSRRLVAEWSLGGLLEAALSDSPDDPRSLNVSLGHEIAASVEQFGWKSAEVKSVLERIAEHLKLKASEVDALVEGNVEEAAKIAARYGVPKVEHVLRSEHDAATHSAASQVAESPSYREPDLQVQLAMLQQIAVELEKGASLDNLLTLVLNGIVQGVGLERAYFALLTPDRRFLRMKLSEGFSVIGPLDVMPDQPNLFQVIIQSGKSLMVTAESRRAMTALLGGDISRWIGVEGFVVTPVSVGGKVLGVLYADNNHSQRVISEEAFSGFRHFGQQVALGLAAAA